MEYKITVLPGDGIGPDIVGETVKVLDAVAKKFGHTMVYDYQLMGGIAYDQTRKSPAGGDDALCARFGRCAAGSRRRPQMGRPKGRCTARGRSVWGSAKDWACLRILVLPRFIRPCPRRVP